MSKKIKIYFGSLDPKDLVSSLYDPETPPRSKTPILLSLSMKNFKFSRDFTIGVFGWAKLCLSKWPIFDSKYLFRCLPDQYNTYRGYTTWIYVSSQKKFFEVGQLHFNISKFSWFFPYFAQNLLNFGGLWSQK